MRTPYGWLTYCTNIHAGESWEDHFARLQQSIPFIKSKVAPDQQLGIGLRLSSKASVELSIPENLEAFQTWLKQNDSFVFTMNGFPYGGFHQTRVKDQVHAPDWTTEDRVQYTIRLAELLAALLPDGMKGGISTSPLSYRFWHRQEEIPSVITKATDNVLSVVEHLIHIKSTTGKSIHLDIEPEPDGLLGEFKEFLHWYTQSLLPQGNKYLKERFGWTEEKTGEVLREHVQLCYDVCHFAIGYEDHEAVLHELNKNRIKTGKIQISAALKAQRTADTQKQVTEAFASFNEPVYLHQVVGRQKDGQLIRYADMPEALADANNDSVNEWRAHFHVPLFVADYNGRLQATQSDIEEVLSFQQQKPFTSHLEIETYTWEVLPEEMRLPINESIVRELQWVLDVLKQQAPATTNKSYHE